MVGDKTKEHKFFSIFQTFCQLFTPHTLTYWLAQLPISDTSKTLQHVNGYISLPTAHTFRFFSPTWDYFPSISQNMFSDLISLSLFLRSGIQLLFTASMLVLLFIASQIRYHQCEAKMKRSQISVRRKISGLLCVKSTSFSFLFLFFRSGI